MTQVINWKKHPEMPIMVSDTGHCYSLTAGKLIGGELAICYNVSKSTIKAICNGQNWRQVKVNDTNMALSAPIEELIKTTKQKIVENCHHYPKLSHNAVLNINAKHNINLL